MKTKIMTTNVFTGFFTTLLLVFAGCGGSSGKSAADASSDFQSAELKAAEKIVGEYTGKADVNWGIQGHIPLISGEEEIADLKISIAHSGDDNNKQLLFRVEGVESVPADDEAKEEGSTENQSEQKTPEFFCVLLKNFTIKETGQVLEFLVNEEDESSKKISTGEVQSVSTLSSIVLDGEALNLEVDKSDRTGQVLNPEKVTDLSKTGSAPSFSSLFSGCNFL